jgi:thiol-disulfide isomerase/thioredoxin
MMAPPCGSGLRGFFISDAEWRRNLRNRSWLIFFLLACLRGATVLPVQSDPAAERRVVDYLIRHVEPGKPLIVSELYNSVFTGAEERKVLDRLFNVFFKIPIFVVQYKAATGQIPTLADIGRQFNLQMPGEVQVLLLIMENDPRVPKFITRDPKSGEIVSVDMEAVKRDKRFNQAIERTLTGWSGKQAPAFTVDLLEGGKMSSAELIGRNYLIYFWFSGCPPCVKISSQLVAMHAKYAKSNFTILAVNADRLLELDTTDSERAAYVKKLGFRFPVAHLNKEMQEAYGNIGVYPTFFLIDSQGVIREQYIGYQPPEVLQKSIEHLLNP